MAKSSKHGVGSALLFDTTSTNSGPTVELLKVAETADLMAISVSGVWRLLQSRHLPFYKVGGSVRIAKGDAMSYLARRRVEAIEQ